jgi:hypothetical protein
MTLRNAVVGIALFASAPALAAEYGAAGCGLGSVIIGNKPGFVQVFAATTNGTFASQTFGISSGTSNCADTSSGAKSAKAFIETNREALVKDMARGSGETLRSLAAVAGCSDAGAVGTMLQSRFDTLVGQNEGLADRVVGSLKADQTLACGNLG